VDISLAELALVHADDFKAHESRYGPALGAAIRSGQAVTTGQLLQATFARMALVNAMRELFDGLDALILPVSAAPTAFVSDIVASGADMREVYPIHAPYLGAFNLTGQPTITLPAGQTESGLPIGVQLVGWRLAEAPLLRLAHAFQQCTSWHTRRPERIN